MIFNFWYGQHNKLSLSLLTDVVMPIYHGLAEAGHRVIGFGTSILPAPAVNVLVEFFPVDAFVDFLASFRTKFGDNLVLGVLCPDDPADNLKMAADPQAPRRLTNHQPPGLRGMSDLVLPIYHGLADGGHHVIGFGLGLQTAPVVNVLFEFFPDGVVVDNLVNIKAQSGDRFIFGLICTEDPEDKLVMEDPLWPRRHPNLLRVLPKADFVWTLLPQIEAYEAVAGPSKVALLEYGFTERGFNPHAPTDPALRDIDVMMYGNGTPYRMPVIQALQANGFTCFVSERDTFPDFATTDLVSRAKIVLDIRRGPGVRYPSPTRKALHNWALVVAEDLGPSAIANLYRYGVACPYDALAGQCEQLIRSGAYVEQARAAQASFRAETSMHRNLARAMALPVFERLRASTGVR